MEKQNNKGLQRKKKNTNSKVHTYHNRNHIQSQFFYWVLLSIKKKKSRRIRKSIRCTFHQDHDFQNSHGFFDSGSVQHKSEEQRVAEEERGGGEGSELAYSI